MADEKLSIAQQINQLLEQYPPDKNGDVDVWFWASSDTCKWFNLIVRLNGTPPLCKLTALNLISDSWSRINYWDISRVGKVIPNPE